MLVRRFGGWISRTACAVLAIVVAGGLASVNATTLGGVAPQRLGANTASISGCDTDGITASYVARYDASSQRFASTTVQFSNVEAACDGRHVQVLVYSGSGTQLASGSGIVTMSGTSFMLTMSPQLTTSSGAARLS